MCEILFLCENLSYFLLDAVKWISRPETQASTEKNSDFVEKEQQKLYGKK